jgi:hypothetical protein
MDRERRDANRCPRLCDRGLIFQSDRPNFDAQFAKDFWEDFFTNGHKHDRGNFNCGACGDQIFRRKSDKGGPTIDHHPSWASIKGEVETLTVCFNGAHWEVALSEDVTRIYHQRTKLIAMHRNCNSGKGGARGRDSIAPKRVGDCPGPDACYCIEAR